MSCPERCIHIGDRECDIYEFFSKAISIGTNFLVRVCVDRRTEQGQTMFRQVDDGPIKGTHRIQYFRNGKSIESQLEVRYQAIFVSPPTDKRKKYGPLNVWLISAREISNSADQPLLHWRLLTNISTESIEAAVDALNRYAQRWKIETWHKILKSGCKAEDSKLRTAASLTKLISVFCILSWRIFWTTMLSRLVPEAPASLAFTETECSLLDGLVKNPKFDTLDPPIFKYTMKLACLGGYLARSSNPPPGNMLIWRGLSRLTDIQIGFDLAKKLVGN